MQNAMQEVDTPPDSPLEQSMEEPTNAKQMRGREEELGRNIQGKEKCSPARKSICALHMRREFSHFQNR